MLDLYKTTKKIGVEVLGKVTGYSINDFQIHQVLLKSSTMYQEVEIFFSFEMGKGLFRNDKQLRELKYDLSNECGVMYQIVNDGASENKILKTYGDVGILREKDWC